MLPPNGPQHSRARQAHSETAPGTKTRLGQNQNNGIQSGGQWHLAEVVVAVGTTIADRPPHRSVRARLRIRLLRRMSGVEASIRIGVQYVGWRNPPVQDWGEAFPTHLCALAAADKNTLP